jgi:hypothetical protein
METISIQTKLDTEITISAKAAQMCTQSVHILHNQQPTIICQRTIDLFSKIT